MNNLLKAAELTIWIESILHNCAPTESFLPFYHLYHLSLYGPKLAFLSLAWNSTLWHSWFLWWRKSWHHIQELRFLRLILKPHVLLFFPDMFPEAWSLMAWQSFPDSSIWSWWELTWSSAERAVPWPLSSCQACQDPQVFPVSALVPGRMRVEGVGGGVRLWGRQEDRLESKQWDSGITSLWPISLRSALNASIWKQPNYCWPLHRLQNTAVTTN